MSEQEEFLARWIRLKREMSGEAQPEACAMQRAEIADSSSSAPTAPEALPVAGAPLPAIESITAESDICPFLQLGVPAELARAALRSAWTVDPTIRDFVGIAESQWDFNDPSAMPGFGPLTSVLSAQSVVKPSVSLLDGALAALRRPPEVVNPNRDGQVDNVWLSSGMGSKGLGHAETTRRADNRREDNANARPRRHGSALPK